MSAYCIDCAAPLIVCKRQSSPQIAHTAQFVWRRAGAASQMFTARHCQNRTSTPICEFFSAAPQFAGNNTGPGLVIDASIPPPIVTLTHAAYYLRRRLGPDYGHALGPWLIC